VTVQIKDMKVPKSSALMIITGQNLNRHSCSDKDASSEGLASYRLMEEVQNVLIEGIFPPVSTSTLPGNAGRVLVHLKDMGL
jgi:hypothetical protein